MEKKRLCLETPAEKGSHLARPWSPGQHFPNWMPWNSSLNVLGKQVWEGLPATAPPWSSAVLWGG